jgi:hypothetical protein
MRASICSARRVGKVIWMVVVVIIVITLNLFFSRNVILAYFESKAKASGRDDPGASSHLFLLIAHIEHAAGVPTGDRAAAKILKPYGLQPLPLRVPQKAIRKLSVL